MGAGKSTVGREVARRVERPFVDLDEEIERRHGPITRIFDGEGEAAFRRIEEAVLAEALAAEPSVLALGGGTTFSPASRARLAASAYVVLLDVDVDTAWSRVAGGDRPLARDEGAFRRLFEERRSRYREDPVRAIAPADPDSVLLEALRVRVGAGRLADVRSLLSTYPGGAALIADARILELHRVDVEGELHRVPPGEEAKRIDVVRRLWEELRIGRDGVVVAVGGGTTTDAAGFVAATYLRGVAWVAVPTTLVGQVDAAVGGKTGIDLELGKNLAGAFHLPEAVVVDPEVLATLPDEERRQGMAEVVKTGLLAGEPLWEFSEAEMVRRCAAFKCAVVLSDPLERGRRAILNLGHTFGHALEAASGYTLRHGDAVALGLLAALRLSGQPTDAVEEVLRPKPVRVDRELAWDALKRDKKAAGGRTRLVLMDAPGRPAYGVELPDADVRTALEALIAG